MTADLARDPALAGLAGRFWERLLELDPRIGTVVGDERYDDRLPDPGPAGRDALRRLYADTLAAARQLEAANLSADDRITFELIDAHCQTELAKLDLRADLLVSVNQKIGPQVWLTWLVQTQPADSPPRLERLCTRLAAFADYIDAHLELVREAVGRGLVQPRLVADRTIGQLERLLDLGAARSPLTSSARVTGDAARQRVADTVDRHVLPALARLLTVIRDEYMPHVREEPGLCALEDGEERYALLIRQFTTVAPTASWLHEQGRHDLAAIAEEQRHLAAREGARDVDAYRQSLASDPANVPVSEEALLARLREDMQRAWDAVGQVFGRLPVTECRIEPADQALAPDMLGYYNHPSPGGERPGVLYVTTTNLHERLYSRYATINYHETLPGHHLQLALEAEIKALTPLRRFMGDANCGAFVEGWALYAERVADEIGLFRNQQERFGMLESQAWRDVRLVVDTGIHAFGWNRQRALEAFVAATGMAGSSAEVEIDRYIANPGQALSYRVGQMQIEKLRAESAASVGAVYSLSAFHDALVGHGSLPLPVLEALVRQDLGLATAP